MNRSSLKLALVALVGFGLGWWCSSAAKREAPSAKRASPVVSTPATVEPSSKIDSAPRSTAGTSPQPLAPSVESPESAPISPPSQRDFEIRLKQLAINRSALITELDRTYARFYKTLSLPPEQMAQLRRLLAERESIPYLVSVALQNQGISDDPTMADSIAQAEAARVGERIAKLLTADEQQRLEVHSQTKYQLDQLEGINSRLGALKLDLNPQQETAILTALRTAEAQPLATPAYGAGGDAWSEYLKKRQAIDKSVLAQVAPTMTAAQLAALRELFGERLLPVDGLRELGSL